MKNCGVLVPRQVSTGTQLSAVAGRTALSRSTPKPTDVTKVLQVGGKLREFPGGTRAADDREGPRGWRGGHAPVAEEDTKSLPGATGS